MKKGIIIMAISICGIANAQITIDSGDMPSAGDTIRLSSSSNLGTFDPSDTGADYTWDFSSLTPDEQRLEEFVTVGDSPIAYQLAFSNVFLYPDHVSNLSQSAPDQDIAGMLTLSDVYNYYSNESGSYRQTGFGANINSIPLPVRYDTIETVYNFPLNFGDSYDTKLYWQASLPSLGYYSQYKLIQNEVEGWGSLVLPNGTHNVLKVKRTIQEVDSLYVDQFSFGTNIVVPESIEYLWLAKSSGIPVLKIAQTDGQTTEIVYQDIYDGTIGIAENEKDPFTIFPNPSTGVFNVNNFKEVESISVYNLSGAKMEIEKNETLDLTHLENGIYLVKVLSKKGTIVTKQITKM